MRAILASLGRDAGYVEISLDSNYSYNPLHNDLDAYALAYGIASLISNLFGRGKSGPSPKCCPARMPLKSATFKKMKLRPR